MDNPDLPVPGAGSSLGIVSSQGARSKPSLGIRPDQLRVAASMFLRSWKMINAKTRE